MFSRVAAVACCGCESAVPICRAGHISGPRNAWAAAVPQTESGDAVRGPSQRLTGKRSLPAANRRGPGWRCHAGGCAGAAPSPILKATFNRRTADSQPRSAWWSIETAAWRFHFLIGHIGAPETSKKHSFFSTTQVIDFKGRFRVREHVEILPCCNC
jgi:hypothetical protein